MTRSVPLPEPFRSSSFRVADALNAGISGRRLDGRDMASPFSGIRVPAHHVRHSAPEATSYAEHIIRELAVHYAPRLTTNQFFSHTTAAALWGIPLPQSTYWSNTQRADTPPRRSPPMIGALLDARRLPPSGPRARPAIHVSARAPARGPETQNIIGHRLTPPLIDVSHSAPFGRGLPVSTPVTTWLQLCTPGSGITHDDLVAAADYLVRRPEFPEHGRPFTSIQELVAATQSYRGRGKRRAVAALRDVREGSDSRPESLLRLLLGRAGLPEPELNPVIATANGMRIGLADLVYQRWKVIVEYDGDQHRWDTAQYEHDMTRLQDFHLSDWLVLRFRKTALFNTPQLVAHQVRSALLKRGWTP